MIAVLFALACTKPEPPVPSAPSGPVLRWKGKEVPLVWTPLVHDGQAVGDQIYGSRRDLSGKTLDPCNGEDFNSLSVVDGQITLATHIECGVAAVWVSKLDQDPQGKLSLREAAPVDMTPVRGTHNLCAGSLSPWGTHLFSEEYETNAPRVGADGLDPDNWQGYNGLAALYGGDGTQLNPYDYNWIGEITLSGTPAATKRYAMGRFSHELALVMPDERTVYMSDDGPNTALYMFIADKAKDLSAGTLYAARFVQVESRIDHLEWVPLGHASEAEVEAWIHGPSPKFEALFDKAEPADGACPAGFSAVNTTWGFECLKVRDGQATLASRLESRRYAALQGATTELSKTEGLALDPAGRELFLVASSVVYGMAEADPKWDLGRPDTLRLPPNPCGAIFGFKVVEGVRDSAGGAIDSAWVVQDGRKVLEGRPEGEVCAPDAIANPDNIAWMDGLLLVAEDSGRHNPNVLWAADPSTGALQRIFDAPPWAEVSGLGWYPDINGFGYITISTQSNEDEHPSEVGVLGPIR